MDTVLKALRKNSVFQMLDEVHRTEFARLANSRDYLKGEFLCLQGESWPYLFIVTSGLVKAYKDSDNGRSLLITNIYQFEIFWGVAFFGEDAPNPVRLEAYESSRIYLWNHSQCLPVFHKDDTLSRAMSRLLVQRITAQGAIQINCTEFVFTDRQRLEKLTH